MIPLFRWFPSPILNFSPLYNLHLFRFPLVFSPDFRRLFQFSSNFLRDSPTPPRLLSLSAGSLSTLSTQCVLQKRSILQTSDNPSKRSHMYSSTYSNALIEQPATTMSEPEPLSSRHWTASGSGSVRACCRWSLMVRVTGSGRPSFLLSTNQGPQTTPSPSGTVRVVGEIFRDFDEQCCLF